MKGWLRDDAAIPRGAQLPAGTPDLSAPPQNGEMKCIPGMPNIPLWPDHVEQVAVSSLSTTDGTKINFPVEKGLSFVVTAGVNSGVQISPIVGTNAQWLPVFHATSYPLFGNTMWLRRSSTGDGTVWVLGFRTFEGAWAWAQFLKGSPPQQGGAASQTVDVSELSAPIDLESTNQTSGQGPFVAAAAWGKRLVAGDLVPIATTGTAGAGFNLRTVDTPDVQSAIGDGVSTGTTGVKSSWTVTASVLFARLRGATWFQISGTPTVQLLLVRGASTIILYQQTMAALGALTFSGFEVALAADDVIQWNVSALSAGSADCTISVDEVLDA